MAETNTLRMVKIGDDKNDIPSVTFKGDREAVMAIASAIKLGGEYEAITTTEGLLLRAKGGEVPRG